MNAARDSDGSVPGRSFSVETTGGIAAGVIITILTSGILNTWELLLMTVILYIAYFFLTYVIKGKAPSLAVKTFFLLLISLVIIADTDKLFRQILLPAVKITETKDTPYGNITRADYSGEESIYYNQRLLTYTNDAMECEENVHYAMLQREKHDRVLLLSGSPLSHLREISKYNVSEVVYVESDPGLAGFYSTNDSAAYVRLRSVYRDAYSYITRSEGSYDAIIMLLPPPSTLSLNRYYTYEFFRKARSRLSSEGVFICSPGPNDNYFNDESVNLYSSVFNSLSAVFRYVEPVAGNKLYLIASDEPLSVAFGSLAERRGIVNHYVNQAFLSDDLIRNKSDEIRSLFRKEVRKNTTAFPVACLHFQEYSFSRDLNEKLPAILLIIAAFVIPVIAVKRSNMLMYFSASALAGFEIIALLMIQMAAGNMYQLTGLIIAVVMTGLAAGAGTGTLFPGRTGFRMKVLFLAFVYLAIGLSFSLIHTGRGTFIPVLVIMLTTAVPSFITGNIFRELTTGTLQKEGAGATYSADLAGSALGFIILSGVAVPAFGIRNSIILLSLLIFAGIIFGTKGK
jgi:spermidine synthase